MIPGKLRFIFLDIGIWHRKMIDFSIGAANASKFWTQMLTPHMWSRLKGKITCNEYKHFFDLCFYFLWFAANMDQKVICSTCFSIKCSMSSLREAKRSGKYFATQVIKQWVITFQTHPQSLKTSSDNGDEDAPVCARRCTSRYWFSYQYDLNLLLVDSKQSVFTSVFHQIIVDKYLIVIVSHCWFCVFQPHCRNVYFIYFFLNNAVSV